jgi:hypothetical protein
MEVGGNGISVCIAVLFFKKICIIFLLADIVISSAAQGL